MHSPDKSFERAHWIWCDGEPRPRNFYLYLRKTFELTSKAKSSHVCVSADSRYQLFVNGKFVNRGPARCDRRWQVYDEWDVARYLRAGRNVLAALVHHYGEWTFSYMLGRGGFICQADIALANGDEMQLQTEESWKVLPATAWERRAPRLSVQLGFSEVYDARQSPKNWTFSNFDDSKWQKAKCLGQPPCEPWPNLVRREIPAMKEKIIYPNKVLELGELHRSISEKAFLYRLNFARLFNVPDPAVAYAATSVWSPKDEEFEIHAGSHDPMMLWINDELVISQRAAPVSASHEVIAHAKLHSGWNKVLVKFLYQAGDWRFHFYFTGKNFYTIKYAAHPKAATAVSVADSEAPWMVIGPFECADGTDGFEKIYPPEQEVDYRKKYFGKNNAEIAWKSAGPSLEIIPISAQMLRAERLPSNKTKIKNIAGLIKPRGNPAVIRRNEKSFYAVIDFGKEVTGFPRLKISGARGGEMIDLGYGEILQGLNGAALSPVSKNFGVLNPDRDHVHYADRYICKSGNQNFQTFDKRAFRYLELHVHNLEKSIKIGPVALLFSTYPVATRGSFQCSDRRLNKIWEIGKYTVQLNMEDGYTDCPWRERAQWWGDVRIEALINYYAFGDLKLIRRALQLQTQSQNVEGIIGGIYPTDWQGGKLPTFTLIWILTLWDYYLFSGDKELAHQLFPNAQKALSFFETYRDRNDLLNDVPYWNFVDWAKVETAGESTAMNCFYYRALVCAARLAAALNAQAATVRYKTLAEKVQRAINLRLWNAELGVYQDARLNGRLIEQVSQQANSLAIAFGIAPKEKWPNILDYIHAPTKSVIQAGTPYFSFYVLAAFYQAGRHAQALRYIRERWGKMLDWGATTWWETWQPTASFCHGWSAAPTHDLPAEFLGIKPLAAGWREIEIKPNPVGLKWAKGRVPTPRGEIKITWEVISKNKKPTLETAIRSFELRVELPSDCLTRLFVPLAGKERIAINHQRKKLPDGVTQLDQENGTAKFDIKNGGKYKFETK